MTDFETHPVGTADLVKRLRSNTPNMAIGLARHQAAARIEQLEAELTRANAAAAAAYEVVSKQLAASRETFCYASPGSDEEFTSLLLGFDTAAGAIRALATADHTAALDKLVSEAEARGMERASEIANKLLVRAKFGGDTPTEVVYNDFVGAAILAASKKGGA